MWTDDLDKSNLLDQLEVRRLLYNMLTTESEAEKEEQIKKIAARFDADNEKKVSFEELKTALQEEGFLNEFFGQNINYAEAADRVYTAKMTSRACIVM